MPKAADFIAKAQFTHGAQRFSQLPEDTGLEVAFAGRSNAGKSSAINAITRRKALARTSRTPGRTQQINFFALDEHRRLVDLPGYGYAKVSQSLKREWDKTLDRYLQERQALRGLILIMDCRHPLKEFDRQLLAWATASKMPVHILLTKADKLTRNKATGVLQSLRHQLEAEYPVATVQLFSATKGIGIEQAQEQLADWLEIDTDSAA
jgi:GTP-binding protein